MTYVDVVQNNYLVRQATTRLGNSLGASRRRSPGTNGNPGDRRYRRELPTVIAGFCRSDARSRRGRKQPSYTTTSCRYYSRLGRTASSPVVRLATPANQRLKEPLQPTRDEYHLDGLVAIERKGICQQGGFVISKYLSLGEVFYS